MDLRSKNVLITAGPSIEKIDDVRFISNFSTGKMGYALAQAAEQEAANVFLISGPVSIPKPNNVKVFEVESAQEMFDQVHSLKEDMDLFIMSAAVSDYRPKNKHSGKIKKEYFGDNLTIELEKNPDILKSIGENKRDNQFLVGFALESQDPINNAKRKLINKNCDLIILNTANTKDSGFGGDYNTVKLLFKNGNIIDLPTMKKSDLAFEIIEHF